MNVKVTNYSNKKITLIDGKNILPKESVYVNVEDGSEVKEQLESLVKKGLLSYSN